MFKVFKFNMPTERIATKTQDAFLNNKCICQIKI